VTAHRLGSALAVLVAAVSSAGIATAQPLSSPFRPSVVATDALGGFVAEAASRFAIPEAWIRTVMRIESGGMASATSPAGAMGLMQLMPATWGELRARLGLGADPYDPHDNIIAGAAYLRELFDRYGPAGVAAAYNAGPGRWEDHLASARPLPAETLRYISRFASVLNGESDLAGVPRALEPGATPEAAPLFVALSNDPAAIEGRGDDVGAASLSPIGDHPTEGVAPIPHRQSTSGPVGAMASRRFDPRGGPVGRASEPTTPDTLFVARTPSGS